MTSIAISGVRHAQRVLASLAVVARVEFSLFLVALLSVAQVPAEYYLTSFGPSGMSSPTDWQTTIALAYDVRHWETLLLLLPFGLLLMALLPAGVFLALSRRSAAPRRFVAHGAAITLFVAGLLAVATWPPRDIRREGFHRAAMRMTPLVEAIRRFETETGRPPRTLTELTPKYLLSIRDFGVRGCSPPEYSRAGPNADWRWQLDLTCPNGLLTLDRFFFRPTGVYPAWQDLERMGEWAYFWD
jgi:hypothetical protein